jgi:hypothetical protein
MTTTIYEIETGEPVALYTLEPATALVCAFEQLRRKNHNTWDYKSPEEYPIQRQPHGLLLGDLYAPL